MGIRCAQLVAKGPDASGKEVIDYCRTDLSVINAKIPRDGKVHVITCPKCGGKAKVMHPAPGDAVSEAPGTA